MKLLLGLSSGCQDALPPSAACQKAERTLPRMEPHRDSRDCGSKVREHPQDGHISEQVQDLTLQDTVYT